MIEYCNYESPLGLLALAFSERALCALCFATNWDRLSRRIELRFGANSLRESRMVRDVDEKLDAYFAGDLRALDHICADTGGTPFQQRVWSVLREVSVGTTISYDELARRVGCTNGARAVGAANAANPVSLVVPCHRVIRADGNLCGYAGGIERKAWLLRHEHALT